MKCHIVENGGYIFLILCLWISVTSSAISEKVISIQEYCSSNLYIHNIEPGEPYQFTLKSEASTGISKPFQKSKRKCRKELKTSDPAAHFIVLISNMTIPACPNCRCNYFEISDVGHSKRYCDTSETEYFVSKSDELTISFFHGPGRKFDVTFTFTVERNVYEITGSPDNLGTERFIETPYFPIPYSPSYRAEYVLQSDDVESHVVLLFLDFQISTQSFIEVVGNNDTHPTKFHGNIFRPPAIVSQSNFLSLKFESGDEDGMPGFRALCAFVKTPDLFVVPYTDCGGHQSGQVGFMNIKTQTNFALYDCVWQILSLTFSTKSYMSVSIHLKDIGHKSTLEIRSGPHSTSKIVKIIDCAIQNCTILDIETTVSASTDFYIRFHGYLDVHSVVNMTYSPYRTGICSQEEFMCEDGRCLQPSFVCDGIKHCPNGTDEIQCPTTVNLVPIPSPPSIKRENIQSDDTYKPFFILVLVGSFALITVFLSISIFLCKYRKYTPVNIEADNQVIGEMSDVMPPMYPVNMYSNDCLPSYEDFIKSSDCYPPILYTRAKERFAPKDTCMQCTTSFSTGSRMRHHSDSYSFRSSNTGSDMFTNATDASCPQQTFSNFCEVEIVNNSLPVTSNSIQRSYSLDSKLNDLVKHDTCHLFLSIMHPVCSHMHVECHTLPAKFKMSTFKTNADDPKGNATAWLPSDLNLNDSKERRFSWSFVSHSSSGSDILTVVKTRCCSDPCKGISVHCSLYP